MKMKVIEVPQVLFQEFSQRLGYKYRDERKLIYTYNGYSEEWELKELDPELTGFEGVFEGAIGFRQAGEHALFALWDRIPSGKRTVFEPEAILTISAGPERSGSWGHGRGCHMRETAMAKLRSSLGGHEFWLELPAVKVISQILLRAAELTVNSERAQYWEKERYPEGNYTHSPFP